MGLSGRIPTFSAIILAMVQSVDQQFFFVRELPFGDFRFSQAQNAQPRADTPVPRATRLVETSHDVFDADLFGRVCARELFQSGDWCNGDELCGTAFWRRFVLWDATVWVPLQL